MTPPSEPGSDAQMDPEVMDRIRDSIIKDDVEQEKDTADFQKWYDDNKNEWETDEQDVEPTP